MIFGFLTFALVNVADVHAREHKAAHVESATTDSSPTMSGDHSLGVGLTTIGTSLSTGWSAAPSVMFDLSATDAIQAYLSIPTTSGNFNFLVGGLYKHTLSESQGTGIHIGGGAGVGTLAGNFTFKADGIFGFHFPLTGNRHLVADVDAGPSFILVSSTPTISSFSIAGFSPLLGLSLHYFF